MYTIHSRMDGFSTLTSASTICYHVSAETVDRATALETLMAHRKHHQQQQGLLIDNNTPG